VETNSSSLFDHIGFVAFKNTMNQLERNPSPLLRHHPAALNH